MTEALACADYTVHACVSCIQCDTTEALAYTQYTGLCTLQCRCLQTLCPMQDSRSIGTVYCKFLQALCTRGQGAHPQLSHLTNAVVNINIPAQDPFHGFYLAHQGSGIVDLNYQQVTKDTVDQKEGHMLEAYGNEQQAKTPNALDQSDGVRTFRNFAGEMRWYTHAVSCHKHCDIKPDPINSAL